MKLWTRVSWSLIAAALIGSVNANAQRSPSREGGVPVVEVVGCLVSAPNDTWVLTSGSDPVISTRPSTTTEAVQAAAARPLGTQRYRLLGLAAFRPAEHAGHKMVVKGLLIKDQKETRVNVTSFQMAAAGCEATSGNK